VASSRGENSRFVSNHLYAIFLDEVAAWFACAIFFAKTASRRSTFLSSIRGVLIRTLPCSFEGVGRGIQRILSVQSLWLCAAGMKACAECLSVSRS
jgi:hypothetical protein